MHKYNVPWVEVTTLVTVLVLLERPVGEQYIKATNCRYNSCASRLQGQIMLHIFEIT